MNAFAMAAPGHQSTGLWRHPDDQSHRYTELSYWLDLARLLEKHRFDSIFLADGFTPPAIYGGSHDAALRGAVQTPHIDPMLLIPAMAGVTEHLSFGVTASVSWEPPYHLARRLTTLDHLTNGRLAWNVVTSWHEQTAANMGAATVPLSHDERYDRADEYLEVCYKLWESSWTDGATPVDRANGVYTDAAKVRPINHDGQYFTVPGSFYCEPSPQRTPVIFQAGSSPRGQEFAARHGECIFIAPRDVAGAQYFVTNLRRLAVENGRDGDDVKVFQAAAVVTGSTDEEARRKYREYESHIDYDAALTFFGGISGMDLSGHDPDEPLTIVEAGTSRSPMEMFVNADPNKVWTPRAMAEYLGIGTVGTVFVGGPETVADQIERFAEQSDIDGLNLTCVANPATFVDFAELVMPELIKRGRVPAGPIGRTAREQLHGAGYTRVPGNHPAAQHRR
jgi:FMN-dependent oxidoreductase (nitrilotriacetate monooxygenase family)